MKDIQLQQGETLRLTVTVEDEGAATAEFVATDGVTDVLTSTVAFTGLTADVSTNDTAINPGSYDYYVRITWDDGSIDILPNAADCYGECDFPQLVICELPGVS